jgi:hypothetical protein
VLSVLPVNTRCHHCLVLSSPFRTPPLATGSNVARSRLSAAAPTSLTPRRPPVCNAPAAPVLCHAGPRVAAPRPRSSLLLLPPRGTELTPPPLPRPASAQKRAARRHRALLSFSIPRSTPPQAREHHTPLPFPASHPCRRLSRCGPRRVSDRCRPPPPHGETRQSTSISLFGTALTSLIGPHSSGSQPESPSTLPPVRTLPRVAASPPRRHAAAPSRLSAAGPGHQAVA